MIDSAFYVGGRAGAKQVEKCRLDGVCRDVPRT